MYANIQKSEGVEYNQTSNASQQTLVLAYSRQLAQTSNIEVSLQKGPATALRAQQIMLYQEPAEIDEFEEAVTPQDAISRQLNPGHELSTVTGVDGTDQDEEAGHHAGDNGGSVYADDDYLSEGEADYFSKAGEIDKADGSSGLYRLSEEILETEEARAQEESHEEDESPKTIEDEEPEVSFEANVPEEKPDYVERVRLEDILREDKKAD